MAAALRLTSRLRRHARPLVRLAALCGLLAAGLLPTPVSSGPARRQDGAYAAQGSQDEAIYPQTGFRIGDERFATYFRARGGILTFGYPTSRPFLLLGTRVQFWQRHVMQVRPDGAVGLLNLLDEGLLPYTEFGDASLPAPDPGLAAAAPAPGTAGYGQAVAAFVAAHVPNEWQGRPVGFLDAFLLPGQLAGEADPVMQALVGLEIFGFPTSSPAADPNNARFVYQRFQRGVLHFDASLGFAQPLLLADYLKALITGRNLPPALEVQAAGSRFYRQYNPALPLWLARPALLPGSDLTAAFEREDQALVAGPPASPSASPSPTLPAFAPPAALEPSPTPPFNSPSPTALVLTPTPPVLVPSPTPALGATATFDAGATAITPTPNAAPPHIDGTEPGSAAVGQDIILRGTNFGASPGHVFFTGKLTTAQVWADSNIVVTVPPGATDGTIRVRRADGVFSNAVGFAPAGSPSPTVTETPTVTPTPTLTPTTTLTPTLTPTPTPPPPVIAGLEPQQGIPGSAFLITGSGFGTGSGQVLMGSRLAPVEGNGWSDTSIAARVPSDAGPETVRVIVRRAPDGQLSGHRCYRVLEPTPTATPVAATPTPPTMTPTPTPAPSATPTVSTSC